jgi:F-type H+-transporting ATPase subunit b
MDLQWKELITQALGFLIVVWLLKKYAWSGLLEFIEKRRELIASEFDNIEKSKADAEALKARFDQELADIEQTRRERIQEAVNEASQHAAEIKEEARGDAVELREKAERDITLEMDKANAVLRDRMTSAVITISEKVIRERLDDEKHRELINRFLDEVDLREGTQ